MEGGFFEREFWVSVVFDVVDVESIEKEKTDAATQAKRKGASK